MMRSTFAVVGVSVGVVWPVYLFTLKNNATFVNLNATGVGLVGMDYHRFVVRTVRTVHTYCSTVRGLVAYMNNNNMINIQVVQYYLWWK